METDPSIITGAGGLTASILSPSLEVLMWPAFYMLLAAFALHALILLYHWLSYGRRYPAVWVAMFIHFGVSLSLIGTLLTSALILT